MENILFETVRTHKHTYIWANYSDLTRVLGPQHVAEKGTWDPLFSGKSSLQIGEILFHLAIYTCILAKKAAMLKRVKLLVLCVQRFSAFIGSREACDAAKIPPKKTSCLLKNDGWKIIFLFTWFLFRGQDMLIFWKGYILSRQIHLT